MALDLAQKPHDRLAEMLSADMEAVNLLIRERMASEHAPRIPQVTAHLIEAGGKRLRPMLTLAAARLCGYDGPYHVHLAATVEFIHTATLLHDDVVDESDLRRGRETANALFGNAASVLVGDYLYSRSFQMMSELSNLRVMEILSEHTCQGWLEGYLLTGRHGFFSTYEAFVHVIDSMFNQHAKWLSVTADLPWRRKIASLNYLLASHVWRQDHNGFTHQDPGFLDVVCNKSPLVTRIYLPPDANCLLSVAEHCLKSRDYINVIVAGKQPELWNPETGGIELPETISEKQ